MGTDIHLILEVQDQNNNKWYRPEWDKVKSKYYPEPASILDDCCSERNYSLFFALSGVRYWLGESEAPVPLWPDRGLPEDIGPEVHDHAGDHSFTYFTAGEWREAQNLGKLKSIEEVAPDFYWYVTALFGTRHNSNYSHRWQGIQNMRILVGYDS